MLNNSNVTTSSVTSSKNSVASSSAIKSSSVNGSVNSQSASSSNVAPAKPKKEPASLKPLKERTSVHDVNDNTRNLQITEKNGTVITAALSKPSVPVAESIGDSRWVMTNGGERNQVHMLATTPKYQKKLFQIFRNLEVNGVPTRMNFSFADKHYGAFMWLMHQGDSFLGSKFNTAE